MADDLKRKYREKIAQVLWNESPACDDCVPNVQAMADAVLDVISEQPDDIEDRLTVCEARAFYLRTEIEKATRQTFHIDDVCKWLAEAGIDVKRVKPTYPRFEEKSDG